MMDFMLVIRDAFDRGATVEDIAKMIEKKYPETANSVKHMTHKSLTHWVADHLKVSGLSIEEIGERWGTEASTVSNAQKFIIESKPGSACLMFNIPTVPLFLVSCTMEEAATFQDKLKALPVNLHASDIRDLVVNELKDYKFYIINAVERPIVGLFCEMSGIELTYIEVLTK